MTVPPAVLRGDMPLRSRRRNVPGTLALGLVGLLAAALLTEGLLRVYDPLGQRVWGDRIVLPAHVRKVFHNRANTRLDPEIVFSRNSIGFRGPDPPAHFDDALTIVAVGGSTTECLYLTDGKDWPLALGARLDAVFSGVWLNNAGLDGHSTYGHVLLLRQVITRQRPKVALFLVGANDLGRTELRAQDRALVGEEAGWPVRLARHSALMATLLNLKRGWEAERLKLPYREIDLRQTPSFVPGPKHRRDLVETARAHLPAYAARLEEMVHLCRGAGIEPVFLTQPALYGPGTDDATGVNLARVEVDRERLINGGGAWELLETYNDATRGVGAREGVMVVDLARRLPKSSRLFYDFLHFTNAGADAVAGITFDALCPLLARRFPRYATQACPAA